MISPLPLIAFRQDLYQSGFRQRRDAQWEVLDALLVHPRIHSFPELSCSPSFRRRWPSVYAALEDGTQDEIRICELVNRYLPALPMSIFALDSTSWPRPSAPTLPERQYVYAPAPMKPSIAIGLSYSLLAWVAEPRSSWALPVMVTRIAPTDDAITVGVLQVQHLCSLRWSQLQASVHIVVADRAYGTPRFWRPLRTAGCRVLVRLRKNRVLYRPPGPYAGKGRPARHGPRFAFRDAPTWGPATTSWQGDDPQWGTVMIQAWEHLHVREAPDVPLTILRVAIHQERAQPPEDLWLAWQGPLLPVEQIWQAYQWRWCIETSIRFRKQHLHWTLPQFRTVQACDRWTMLVTLAQWQLFLSRSLVTDRPLPWQSPQTCLTPQRVQQSFGELLACIGSPARSPKPRGNPPGWAKGRPRSRPPRLSVVRKGKKPPGERR